MFYAVNIYTKQVLFASNWSYSWLRRVVSVNEEQKIKSAAFTTHTSLVHDVTDADYTLQKIVALTVMYSRLSNVDL